MTVHLLPGIGGTEDLFRDYHFPFPVRHLGFMPPKSLDSSFENYAANFANHHQIAPGDILVGMSLGGMIAAEISNHFPIRKLILISSGTQSHHIHPVLRTISPAARYLPCKRLQLLARPTSLFGPIRAHMLQMFRDSEPLFITWACLHAPTWTGLKHHPDLFQIHGTRDPVFPFSYQASGIHYPVPMGDHIIALRLRPLINRVLIEQLAPLFN
jgi:pimeloyl-ACP methyl ester carboxylesterase